MKHFNLSTRYIALLGLVSYSFVSYSQDDDLYASRKDRQKTKVESLQTPSTIFEPSYSEKQYDNPNYSAPSTTSTDSGVSPLLIEEYRQKAAETRQSYSTPAETTTDIYTGSNPNYGTTDYSYSDDNEQDIIIQNYYGNGYYGYNPYNSGWNVNYGWNNRWGWSWSVGWGNNWGWNNNYYWNSYYDPYWGWNNPYYNYYSWNNWGNNSYYWGYQNGYNDAYYGNNWCVGNVSNNYRGVKHSPRLRGATTNIHGIQKTTGRSLPQFTSSKLKVNQSNINISRSSSPSRNRTEISEKSTTPTRERDNISNIPRDNVSVPKTSTPRTEKPNWDAPSRPSTPRQKSNFSSPSFKPSTPSRSPSSSPSSSPSPSRKRKN